MDSPRDIRTVFLFISENIYYKKSLSNINKLTCIYKLVLNIWYTCSVLKEKNFTVLF